MLNTATHVLTTAVGAVDVWCRACADNTPHVFIVVTIPRKFDVEDSAGDHRGPVVRQTRVHADMRRSCEVCERVSDLDGNLI